MKQTETNLGWRWVIRLAIAGFVAFLVYNKLSSLLDIYEDYFRDHDLLVIAVLCSGPAFISAAIMIASGPWNSFLFLLKAFVAFFIPLTIFTIANIWQCDKVDHLSVYSDMVDHLTWVMGIGLSVALGLVVTDHRRFPAVGCILGAVVGNIIGFWVLSYLSTRWLDFNLGPFIAVGVAVGVIVNKL